MTSAGFRARPGAPPPGTTLCRAADIAAGAAKVFTFGAGADQFELFVLRPPSRVAPPEAFDGPDGLVAYVNDCPHAHAPLDWQPGQFLDAAGTHLLCTMHGALFRIHDGYCLNGPCPGLSLTPVPIVVTDGLVCVA
ncbi:MAG: Rieske (2Fe-2S) protein [Alphaproteobacteria bacterium]|nr:Rieske (2Fe-2S) protein [Alphaproteobacteria bacterium]